MMEVLSGKVPTSRGLLHERMSMAHFDLVRIAPSDALLPFVENYWLILWDLKGKPPYRQQNLPHPSVNMVIVPGGESGVFGVQTGVWNYTLEGSGRAFGVKFRPGMFRPFTDHPISDLQDTLAPVAGYFDQDHESLEQRLSALNDPMSFATDIEYLLSAKTPIADQKAIEAETLVRMVDETPDILRVEQLAEAAGLNLRSLQRVFDTYIGVSPKWVIERYRLLDAVAALNSGGSTSLTALAHQLGYFDQAHFTRSFKAITGNPPSFYMKD